MFLLLVRFVGLPSLYFTLQNTLSHYLKLHNLFFRMFYNFAIVLWSKGEFFSKSFIALLLPDVFFDGTEPLIVHRKD